VRQVRLLRLFLSLAVFAGVYAWLTGGCSGRILEWILDAGRAAGCGLTQTGGIAWGPGGPFVGDGLRVRAFNILAREGVWLTGAGVGFTAAFLVYACLVRTEHWRLVGYRGPTRCGPCGYTLRGLRGPRCPECGREI
jgi:hypothetical protein